MNYGYEPLHIRQFTPRGQLALKYAGYQSGDFDRVSASSRSSSLRQKALRPEVLAQLRRRRRRCGTDQPG
jgi:hypothetical protein